ncbi:MAG: hypothetical protein EOL95_10465 [Bacteroidia bacterium]|nr:hypothetical protein [Bacteroidia bacterium]
MKKIEIPEVGEVVIREIDNDDREIIQNKGSEFKLVPIPNTNKFRNVSVPKIGSVTKYTFILGIAEAPFFSDKIDDKGFNDAKLEKRLLEYKKINYKIVETLIPYIAEINQVDEGELKQLKDNLQ